MKHGTKAAETFDVESQIRPVFPAKYAMTFILLSAKENNASLLFNICNVIAVDSFVYLFWSSGFEIEAVNLKIKEGEVQNVSRTGRISSSISEHVSAGRREPFSWFPPVSVGCVRCLSVRMQPEPVSLCSRRWGAFSRFTAGKVTLQKWDRKV